MTHAKTFLTLALAAAGLSLLSFTARAAEDEKAHSMTGTLIDNMCGDKKADEAAAASHKAACAMKDSCASSGYQLIVGDKHYKFDDKGNDKAKEYLKDNKDMKVVVDGKMEGDKLEVDSIKPAPKEEKKS
jgi:hypothetical protein